jgi:hypothetical protein
MRYSVMNIEFPQNAGDLFSQLEKFVFVRRIMDHVVTVWACLAMPPVAASDCTVPDATVWKEVVVA